MNLPVKYRPKEFNDVSSQQSIIKILEQQLATKTFVNAYLLSGPSGCGKTTLARIFANKINNGLGEPIEIDAASNNGVDNIRQIIEGADQRALDAEYKIYIIDECHMLTTQAWNALLKTIEETPKYTIFMLCTTEYHKVPLTIQNRCQQYFLTRIPQSQIEDRLSYIAKQEGIDIDLPGIKMLAKLAQGSMRQAIAYLDKVKDYTKHITYESVLDVFGELSYDIFFKLTNAIIDKNHGDIIEIIENAYNNGSDLKVFIDEYISFILDLTKYIIFKSYDVIGIPDAYDNMIKYTTNVEGASKYFNHILDKLLNIKLAIKGDSNSKSTIEISLLNI